MASKENKKPRKPRVKKIVAEKVASYKDLPLHIRMNVEEAPKKEQEIFKSNFTK